MFEYPPKYVGVTSDSLVQPRSRTAKCEPPYRAPGHKSKLLRAMVGWTKGPDNIYFQMRSLIENQTCEIFENGTNPNVVCRAEISDFGPTPSPNAVCKAGEQSRPNEPLSSWSELQRRQSESENPTSIISTRVSLVPALASDASTHPGGQLGATQPGAASTLNARQSV